jgi:RimJ/RimL family protein N-acetyltransferase
MGDELAGLAIHLRSYSITQLHMITLRPVTAADEEFLLLVYASTRAEELARVPWNDEQKMAFVRMQFASQNQHYTAQYPHAVHQIICAQGTPIGRLYMDRTGEDFHILDITVLPQHRNAGAGSCILHQVLQEAAGAGKPVAIYVESFNPSLRLFTRLGFEPVEENGFHLLLKHSS